MTDQERKPTSNSPVKNLSIVKPIQDLAQFGSDQALLHQFIQSTLVKDVDYGIIPGTEKRSLWQPGAEKIGRFYGVGAKFSLIKEVEDWDKGFFYYRYQCKLIHRTTEQFIGDIERSCNSSEKKYSQYSVSERFATEDQRKRAVGRFIDKKGYPRLRVLKNSLEMADVVNTVQSMAQKRAFVACIRLTTAASDYFVSDISEGNGHTPTAPVNQPDPIRQNQMAKLHAVAIPRGFNEERLHQAIFVMFKKRSRTDLTGSEMAELTEKLLAEFKIVGADNKPARINGKTPEAREVASQPLPEEFGKIKAEEVEDGEVEPKTPQMCAQCKEKPTRDDNGFCSDECQDKYWPKKTVETLADKLKKLSKLRKENYNLDEVKLKCGIKVYVDWKKEDKCKCGEVIWWAITDKNKKPMPICAVGPGEWDTHFATCPLASGERKK